MFQLGGVEEVVFDGISRTIDFHVAKSRDFFQRLDLHLHGHARREAVQIHLVGVFSLWFQKQRVLPFVGKCGEFSLYRRAISWSDALYLSIIQRRVVDGLEQGAVHFRVGVASPARQLFQCFALAHKTELVEVQFAGLLFHILKMH